jgi:hypothetical protein
MLVTKDQCKKILRRIIEDTAAQDTKESAQHSQQQLKQAIALVRRHAGLHLSIGEIEMCIGLLSLIEQRACV